MVRLNTQKHTQTTHKHTCVRANTPTHTCTHTQHNLHTHAQACTHITHTTHACMHAHITHHTDTYHKSHTHTTCTHTHHIPHSHAHAHAHTHTHTHTHTLFMQTYLDIACCPLISMVWPLVEALWCACLWLKPEKARCWGVCKCHHLYWQPN